MDKTMNRKKGFSLVELLIVIGIIAVLGGVMLTQFSGSTESLAIWLIRWAGSSEVNLPPSL